MGTAKTLCVLICLLGYTTAGFCETESELVSCLKGIQIVGSGCPSEVEICSVSFENFDLPGDESELAEELSAYIHQPLTQSSLQCIKEAIARFFERHHHPVVLIRIPEQEISDGNLQIQVIESRLGEVRVCQNNWFNSCKMADQISLCQKEPINASTLAEDLRWLNRNPFREIDAIFTPGKEPYTTDVELLVRDRFPLRVFSGVDNTGIPATGRTRYLAGMQASNFFHLDHVLTYQFSSGNDYKDFHSHFLQYSMPFCWRHVLDLFGAYARTETNEHPFHSKGNSYLGSARYTIPLNPAKPWTVSELAAGFDFKRTNNNLLFSDHPVFSKNVNLTQFVLSGRFGYRRDANQFLFNANLYGSPGNFTGDDGDRSHFESLRPGANNIYAYLNAGFYYQRCLPCDYSWTFDVRGQYATTNLLPSEQFGLGGYNSIRGYDEHQTNKDNAILFNTELRTPRWALFDKWNLRRYKEGLQLLAFIDYGLGNNHEQKGDLRSFQMLAGFGPGLRYIIDPYLTIRLDWGIQLSTLIEEHKFKSRAHFALFLNLW